ncbi:hypothetical protein L2K70_01520 [Nocardioides KLBMP 9356]|uniref:Uncharacterized protein n=1 Tax=Nocardioides potassii TaxID=2911371 RepID=A0ABS9H7T5_9ACTN|nr:hypothetical protein [Nocardioides potassii]MCF6376276.1 hypothetical protein [Nocardioides potassii]
MGKDCRTPAMACVGVRRLPTHGYDDDGAAGIEVLERRRDGLPDAGVGRLDRDQDVRLARGLEDVDHGWGGRADT